MSGSPCTTSVSLGQLRRSEELCRCTDDPVATASQHEQELAALDLIEHPTVKAAYRSVGRDLAGPREGVRRDARALRRRVRRGDVLGRGVVVQPGQAATQGQLHHPARPPGGRPPHPRIALGHRQSRQRLPGDPDLRRRALRDPRPRRRAPHDGELLHAVGRQHGHRRCAQRPHHGGRLRRHRSPSPSTPTPPTAGPTTCRSTPEAHEFYIRDVLLDWDRDDPNHLDGANDSARRRRLAARAPSTSRPTRPRR